MNIKLKNKLKKILSSVMAAGMSMSLIPSVSFAAQSNEYVDPADVWIEANGRASEFDINATVTTGTIFCPICDMPTTNISYRVPEYTRTGETAMNRGVYYSDGTCIDGVSKGNLDDGTPGVDAFYTGYHWTKSVCQNCGTINSVDGVNSYSCGKDVYSLNPCDSNFLSILIIRHIHRIIAKRIQQTQRKESIVNFAKVHIHAQPQNRKITISPK